MRISTKYTCFTDPDWELNPLQELAYPHTQTHNHVLATAPTASGKTTLIHMAARKYLKQGGVIAYVGIMKALADQKYEEWSAEDHYWSRYPSAVITGDYAWTSTQQKEVDAAQIIVITPESLLSKLRHINNRKGRFLLDIDMIVWDEIHLVGSKSRGANFETAVMEFTDAVPKAQNLALSATVPNNREFKKWLEAMGDGRDVVLIESDYRAVPIERVYIPYDQGSTTAESERNRRNIIAELVMSKPKEQFMVAVWKKTFGHDITEDMRGMGITSDFHNANADRATRKRIERGFISGSIRVMPCTSTLSVGVNLPARNVVGTACEAGGEDIPVFELEQTLGRAGRPQYDDKGFQFMLLPDKRFTYHRNRIENGEPIKSQLVFVSEVAAHFLGAIYMRTVTDIDAFHRWFRRSLAAQQIADLRDQKIDSYLDEIVHDLEVRRMLFRSVTDEFVLKPRGKIAAQLMLDPYHYADLLRNLKRYFDLTHPTDIDLAKAIGSCSKYYAKYNTRDEAKVIPQLIKSHCEENYWKACSVVYSRIKKERVPGVLNNVNWEIFSDIDRYAEGALRASKESERWEGVDESLLQVMFYRVKLSCTSTEAKMRMSQFKPAEVRALMRLGIYSLHDARNNPHLASEVLSPARMAVLRVG